MSFVGFSKCYLFLDDVLELNYVVYDGSSGLLSDILRLHIAEQMDFILL